MSEALKNLPGLGWFLVLALLILGVAALVSAAQDRRDEKFPDLLFAKMMMLGLPYTVSVSVNPQGQTLIHVELYPDPDDPWDSPSRSWDGSGSQEDLADLRKWIRDEAADLWGEDL